MKKIIVSVFIFVFLLTELLAINVPASSIKAEQTTSVIMLDGKYVSCNGFNILGNNYYKLRDLAKIFNGTTNQFDVVWDKEKNSVGIITGQAYQDINKEESSNRQYYSSYSATLTLSTI